MIPFNFVEKVAKDIFERKQWGKKRSKGGLDHANPVYSYLVDLSRQTTVYLMHSCTRYPFNFMPLLFFFKLNCWRNWAIILVDSFFSASSSHANLKMAFCLFSHAQTRLAMSTRLLLTT